MSPRSTKSVPQGKLKVFKKLQEPKKEGGYTFFIAELEIGAKVERCGPYGSEEKCRAAQAKVTKLWLFNEGEKKSTKRVRVRHKTFGGPHGHVFYHLGKVIKADSLDKTDEICGAGINFFLTLEQAADYCG